MHLKQYPVYLKKRDAVQIFSREVYTNTALVNFSPYEFEITLGPGSSNYEGVKPAVNVRMSPQFAKEFANVLQENVDLYEQQVTKIVVSGEGKK